MPEAPISYDPEIIHEFAKRLYKQAASILIVYTVLGAVMGAAIGAIIVNATSLHRDMNPMIGVLIGAAFFGLFGFSIGRERAFKLKLQAQTALCQVKIEENTRTSVLK